MDELSPQKISARVTALVCISGIRNSSNTYKAHGNCKSQLSFFIVASIRGAGPLKRNKVEKLKKVGSNFLLLTCVETRSYNKLKKGQRK